LVAQEEHAGMQVMCPKCKAVLVVPGAAPPPAVVAGPPPAAAPPGVRPGPPPLPPQPQGAAPEEYYPDDDPDRPRKKGMKKRQRLRLVKLGLGFYYAKILCYLVMVLLYALGNVLIFMAGVAALTRNEDAFIGMAGLLTVLFLVAVVLFYVTPILGLTGTLLNFWVPQKAGARPLAIVAFVLDAVSLLLLLVALVMQLSAVATAPVAGFASSLMASGMAAIVQLVAMLVMLAGVVVFITYLKPLGYYLGEEVSGDEAGSIAITFPLTVVVPPFFLIGAVFVLRQAGCFGLLIILGMFVGWLVGMVLVLLRLLAVIGSLRQVLETRA
jgi:hypothetical protein